MTDPLLHRPVRGDQRLPDHLPAEHALPAHIGAVAPEQVHLDPLEIEKLDQVFDGGLVGFGGIVGHGLSCGAGATEGRNISARPGAVTGFG